MVSLVYKFWSQCPCWFLLIWYFGHSYFYHTHPLYAAYLAYNKMKPLDSVTLDFGQRADDLLGLSSRICYVWSAQYRLSVTFQNKDHNFDTMMGPAVWIGQRNWALHFYFAICSTFWHSCCGNSLNLKVDSSLKKNLYHLYAIHASSPFIPSFRLLLKWHRMTLGFVVLLLDFSTPSA